MSAPILVLRPGDGERLSALQQASDIRFQSAAQWERELEQATNLTLGIDRGGGALAAFVSAALTPDMADIADVLVHPSCRRNGYARTLIHALAKRAGERGIARLTLEVSETNHPAIVLYRDMGFADDGRRRAYYADGSDAILMSRPVTPFAGLTAAQRPSCGHEPD